MNCSFKNHLVAVANHYLESNYLSGNVAAYLVISSIHVASCYYATNQLHLMFFICLAFMFILVADKIPIYQARWMKQTQVIVDGSRLDETCFLKIPLFFAIGYAFFRFIVFARQDIKRMRNVAKGCEALKKIDEEKSKLKKDQ